MLPRSVRLLLCILILQTVSPPARPCSTFYIPNSGQPVFGRNYDWMVEVGLAVVNQRDVVKLAMIPDQPASWKSKYGSVTFNQYGREFPMGGMNEAGLVVEQMWLSETRYPAPDARGALNVLQWVQYQLDTAATVAEVLASDKRVRINPVGGATVHYLVADRHGGCATVEFLDGQLVSHVGKSLPVPVLTNDTYETSVAYLKQHVGFAGTRPVAQTPGSLDRFVGAADLLRRYHPQRSGDVVDYAFDILGRIAQGEFTKWSIVYDIPNQRIHFRTRAATGRRFVDLRQLDFSCEAQVLILDVNRDLAGDVTDRLVAYTPERNQTLVRAAYSQTPFLKDVPATAVEAFAAYPLTCLCEPRAAADESARGD
jgi:choloylglycine hydrolase